MNREPVEVSAPSNIALIKYMGKVDTQLNRPSNASLSYTLENLRTYVRITPIDAAEDQWQPLKREGLQAIELSEKGRTRFLKHFQNLKAKWGVQGHFIVESANNFPSDCGLASSASSFAALTLAAAKMFQQVAPQPWGEDLKELSSLSRMGSGSSCRSLYTPWALWKEEYAEPALLEFKELHHLVVLVESGKKEVSSSEAHKLVVTSPRFEGRIERAHMRLNDLIHALRFNDWNMAVQICWDEFIDMHKLFETSSPAFSYMTDGSHQVLDWLKKQFDRYGDGPIVTMDAGANVHLLFRKDDRQRFDTYKKELSAQFPVMAYPWVDSHLN
ncbi:MAG: diphosphomevalonate decarboxylase [Bdellovibrionia bacterium]